MSIKPSTLLLPNNIMTSFKSICLARNHTCDSHNHNCSDLTKCCGNDMIFDKYEHDNNDDLAVKQRPRSQLMGTNKLLKRLIDMYKKTNKSSDTSVPSTESLTAIMKQLGAK